ncbi:MAG: ORC1-type DNA replication protein [Nitrososphaerota archaeon]
MGMRIFKDESKLSLEYVPPVLPHRENELRLLKAFFSGILKGKQNISVRAIISGSAGTGKTAMAKLFGKQMEVEAKNKQMNLKYIHVNCRVNRTLFTILKRVVEYLKIPLPSRGYSTEELMHGLLNYLAENDLYIILALDDLEVLIKEEGSDPFYFLMKIGEDRDDRMSRLSFIFIVRNPEILNMLESGARVGMLSNIVHLPEYNAAQLYDILSYRASEAFFDNVILEESIRLIADLASERGDARYAIETLWRSGKYAEAEGCDIVTPEHVRKAAASIYPAIKKENLAYLSLHEKLILLAVTRALASNEKAYTTSSELNELYRLVCEEYKVQPKAYTRFWEYLQKLEDQGIIRIKVSSEGIRGRRSYITLPEIPVSILQHELTKLLEGGNVEL